MFLTDKGFKKIISDIYKQEGLTVYNINNTLVLKGIYTRIECQKRFLTKKALGAIIELTGFIPESGEGFVFRKNEEPEFLQEPEILQNRSEYEKMVNTAVFSPLTIDGLTSQYNIMQGNKEKLLVNQVFVSATMGEIKDAEGETDKEVARYNDLYVIWLNNVMSVRATRIRPMRAREKDIIADLKHTDILDAKTEGTDE